MVTKYGDNITTVSRHPKELAEGESNSDVNNWALYLYTLERTRVFPLYYFIDDNLPIGAYLLSYVNVAENIAYILSLEVVTKRLIVVSVLES